MESIAHYIEHTNLSPTVTGSEIEKLSQEALEHNFFGICVPPFWVKKAHRDIGKSSTQLVTVIGFPLGYQMTSIKLCEIESAIENGANEVDMVLNISAFKSKMPWTKIDIAKCAKVAHEGQVGLKVIIETAYLSNEEIVELSKICQDAGADFVKTSTGMAPGGATLEHIRLMRNTLSSSVGIKASGGIRDLDFLLALINAGADRIGTSGGVGLMREFSKVNNHGAL